MSRSKLLRGGIWLTAGNALSAGASFLRNIIVARLVSVEDFGIVVLLSMVLSIAEMVSYVAIDRLLVQAPDGDDPNLQASAHALQVLRGVFSGIILFLTASWIAILFKIPQATWALQVLAIVPLIRSFMHLDTVRFQREMNYRPTFWVDAFPQVLSLVSAIPLTYWLCDYSAIVWATLIQALAQCCVTHLLANRRYRWTWDRTRVVRILSFGWPLLINSLLMFAIFQGDKAVIAVAFSTEVVGWFGAAVMLSMAPALLVTSVLHRLLLPVLARHQNALDEFCTRYKLVVQFCLVAGLLTAVIFCVVGPELLILFFGSRYHEGSNVVIFLGLAQGVRVAKSGQVISSMALGRTKDPLIANLARAATLFLAIVLVSMDFGPSAVALTGLIGELIAYAIAMQLVSIGIKISAIRQIPLLLVWVAFSVISWFVGVGLRGYENLLIHFLIFILWLIIAVLVFSFLSPEIRSNMICLLARRKLKK